MVVDQSADVLAEVVMPTETNYPVQAPIQRSEITGIVEAAAEVAVPSATKQDKFPGAGKLYEDAKHCQKIQHVDFEDVGGFSVLKTQASLYKEIWLNYGHIASNQVLTDFYDSQVVVVGELMDCILEMNHYPLEKVSLEMIADWEEKIKITEKLEFNIVWLRERLDDIKENFAEEKKIKETLVEQAQLKARVIEAEQQLVLAKDKLFALETKITPLLMGRKKIREKCGGGLLRLNFHSNLALVTTPVQKDAIPIEEPINSRNSQIVASKRRRLISSLNM
ncbi:hypothetical protein MKX03_021379 [Papaver bracteatum]|nr:hypothetical protein MKX03_021379 [Papaver bracteatum]